MGDDNYFEKPKLEIEITGFTSFDKGIPQNMGDHTDFSVMAINFGTDWTTYSFLASPKLGYPSSFVKKKWVWSWAVLGRHNVMV